MVCRQGHYQPMRRWNGHPLANQRLGDTTDESEGDQWSHLWSPSSGAGLQTWGRHGYNECGMSHSHWYGQSWLLQTSPDKYSLLLSPRHSLHFSFSPRLFRLTLYEPLEIYGLFWCLDVWPVRWGNENGLCDIQSDKNMDFWKMKYETAHYATG